VKLIRVTTAAEMLAACQSALPVDVAVMCAAVADWRPENPAPDKTKKTANPATLRLVENPDILAAIARHAARPRLVVGFAAETDHVVENAKAKRTRKGADWIVANNVSTNEQGQSVMGGDSNRVHLIQAGGVEDWPEMSKTQVAAELVARITQTLNKRQEGAA
jgi:phosphopantothenoylcysteine decarboxylase/phosphopantothenate--cysteine ligase